MRKFFSRLLKVAAALAVVYALLTAGLYWVMCQPLDRFSAIMARMPGPAFAVLPFVPLWNSARGGSLQVGDAAADFILETTDKKSLVQLSSFRGQKPVVLVFGSYT
ncbi:MAG: hypothetical protein ACRD6I_09110 [Candidatus Acidiferrales bacterium]